VVSASEVVGIPAAREVRDPLVLYSAFTPVLQSSLTLG